VGKLDRSRPVGRAVRECRPARTGPRSKMFTITPIVLSILAVVGLVSVIATKDHWRAATGSPVSLAAGASSDDAGSGTADTPATTTPADDPAAAQAAVAAVDAQQSSSVTFGVAVLDTATGEVTLGRNGTTQFYCASVLKLFLITALLHDQETGKVTLTSQDDSYITRALERSDDNAMDALWEKFGGPALITEMVSLGHLQDTQLPSNLSQWGETLISARDVIAVYQYVMTSLSSADRTLVLGDLGQAADSGADGFDQAFGLLHEPRVPNVKGKQGWMCYKHMEMLHTTGTLGSHESYVAAILSHQPEQGNCNVVSDPGWTPGRDRVTAATTALINALGPAASR
jgi:hypothetical protein